jgi:hypothetical protein
MVESLKKPQHHEFEIKKTDLAFKDQSINNTNLRNTKNTKNDMSSSFWKGEYLPRDSAMDVVGFGKNNGHQ